MPISGAIYSQNHKKWPSHQITRLQYKFMCPRTRICLIKFITALHILKQLVDLTSVYLDTFAYDGRCRPSTVVAASRSTVSQATGHKPVGSARRKSVRIIIDIIANSLLSICDGLRVIQIQSRLVKIISNDWNIPFGGVYEKVKRQNRKLFDCY